MTPTALDTRLAPRVAEIIASRGKDAVLIAGVPVYDPSSGEATFGTEYTVTITGGSDIDGIYELTKLDDEHYSTTNCTQERNGDYWNVTVVLNELPAMIWAAPFVEGELPPTEPTSWTSVFGSQPLALLDVSSSLTPRPEYTVKIIPPYPYDSSVVNGSSILNTDVQTYIAASGLEVVPSCDMRLRFDSIEYTIVSVGRVYTGELVALYSLQLRA